MFLECPNQPVKKQTEVPGKKKNGFRATDSGKGVESSLGTQERERREASVLSSPTQAPARDAEAGAFHFLGRPTPVITWVFRPKKSIDQCYCCLDFTPRDSDFTGLGYGLDIEFFFF